MTYFRSVGVTTLRMEILNVKETQVAFILERLYLGFQNKPFCLQPKARFIFVCKLFFLPLAS